MFGAGVGFWRIEDYGAAKHVKWNEFTDRVAIFPLWVKPHRPWRQIEIPCLHAVDNEIYGDWRKSKRLMFSYKTLQVS